MAKVERGVVSPPNQMLQGLAATRSHSAGVDTPATQAPKPALFGSAVGGSADLTRQPGPIARIDHRFNVENARMPEPAAAIEPGKGAVPVNPFRASRPDLTCRFLLADDARRR